MNVVLLSSIILFFGSISNDTYAKYKSGSVTTADKGVVKTMEKSEKINKKSKCEPVADAGYLKCVDGDNPVYKKILDNGMTILVRPIHTVPQVSMQIWYNVGSKNEHQGERGIAHLIEHMIFKGTQGKDSLNISESDINIASYKLSGAINAFTSYDYTGYLFDFPTHHWQEVLPIMADSMKNAAFKDEHLNSEMKAVIQELKMINDQHARALFFAMIGNIFHDHPYHYPLIGYKQDLWNIHGKDLKSFYKKHYLPNNATLVVVGDVEPEEVFTEAKKYFGDIKPNKEYEHETFYHRPDIESRSITMYRDVQQPIGILAYAVPGIQQAGGDQIYDVLTWILGKGKGSRLHKKLVDELKLVTSLDLFNLSLFDHSLFFIFFEPKNIEDIEKIETIIQEEIDKVAQGDLSEKEVRRAQKNVQMKFYNLLESASSQAYKIGMYYTALGDEQYVFTLLDEPVNVLKDKLQDLLKDYFRKSVQHKGFVLPLPEGEKEQWAKLQELSDKEDVEFLSKRVRTTEVEPPSYTQKIKIHEPGVFNFPKPDIYELSNGLKVLTYCNSVTPKIDVIIAFKANWYYDSASKPGLYTFVTKMMTEGTKKYTAEQLADELESRGMGLSVYPGGLVMNMLAADFEKGMEILEEVLSRPRFDKDEIEKVRDQMLSDVKSFWDEPSYFASQLLKERVYKRHPYSKNILGNEKSVKEITRDDIIEFHKNYITPKGARIAVVGDIENCDIQDSLEKMLGKWSGPEVKDIEFPTLAPVKAHEINYPINRDQVVLGLGGLSIDRKNEDYDKLLLFDQIFGGGVLGSMASRLFMLREQTGMFYTISGSMLSQASEQPGMVVIKTIVSLDKLDAAEKAIRELVVTVPDTLTDEELADAKRAVINSLTKSFESNAGIAQIFLLADKYGFPRDFFDTRAATISKVKLDDVKKAVKKYLKNNELLVVRVGRVDEKTEKQ